MNNRPRCRDWTALTTQQLRLRNLIQISGHNIVTTVAKPYIYYTLHRTSMSAPFFTSEKLESPKNAIWAEINCQAIVKSTAQSVCVRIWQHKSDEDESTTEDEVLFLWGVYFSGLVPISKRTDVKLLNNSLVFHIHGGFFTSANCLFAECVPRQLSAIGFAESELIAADISKLSTSDTCDQLIHKINISNENNIVEVFSNEHQPLPSSLLSSMTITTSPTISPSSTMIASVVADPNRLKLRYIEKNFYKFEIRYSYNVDKLLALQQKQRAIQHISQSSKELIDKICMKSAFCLDLKLIANKATLYRPRGNPSMGRTLNRLLFQTAENPKPEDLLLAQDYRRRIETARFRCQMLVHERNNAYTNIRKLELSLSHISDGNIEKESWLMANYRGLGRERDAASEQEVGLQRQQQTLATIQVLLQQRRQQILRELEEIYCIQRDVDSGEFYRINGAILPNSESFTDTSSPSNASAALGYAAHLTVMCSVILNCPLR